MGGKTNLKIYQYFFSNLNNRETIDFKINE